MPMTRALLAGMVCPDPVTWTNDIQGMFTTVDAACMNTKGLDLTNYQAVKINAVSIYNYVENGDMPPPGTVGPNGQLEPAWSQAQLGTFACWIKQGCPQ